jgi:outer membrane receptor protein involved in Fe transport
MYEKFDNIYRDRLLGNLSVRLNLTDKIYIQGRLGQDYYARKRDYNNPTGTGALTAAPFGFVNGSYYMQDTWFRETNYDFLIGAQDDFGDFGVDVTLGGNQMFRQIKTANQSAVDFVDRGIYTIMNGRAKTSNHSLTERAVNSLYGAAEVSYKNFLYLNLTARNDWFSTLAPDNRSILYPSATASFIFSEVITLPEWFTFGKARLSYAEVGDDNVQPYSNVQYYALNSNLYPSIAGSVPVGNSSGSTIPNPDLRPLRVSEIEAGLDFRFLNGRIVFDIAYYNKLTRDQIVEAVISYTSGYSTQLINVGESRSKGIETALTVKPVETRNFTWTLSGNLSYNTSEVLKLGLTDADTMLTFGGVRAVVGQKLGQIFTWQQAVDPVSGKKVFDNGGMPVRAAEQVSIGSNQPTWFGGITNTLDYKGIIFSALIDFKLGDDYMMLGGPNRHYWRHGLHKGTLPGRDNPAGVVGDGVVKNSDGTYSPNTKPVEIQAYYEQFHGLGITDYWQANAGFWKLRQMSLGYDFRAVVPKVSFVKGLRLSFVANNVAILKKWVENMDPENLTDYADTGNGEGWTAMPPTRNLGFNLNVKF